MRTLEERVKRLENAFARLQHGDNIMVKKRMPEAEVVIRFGVSAARLKQLRLGYRGVPPILTKWSSCRGRRIEYDVAELERYFRQSPTQ